MIAQLPDQYENQQFTMILNDERKVNNMSNKSNRLVVEVF